MRVDGVVTAVACAAALLLVLIVWVGWRRARGGAVVPTVAVALVLLAAAAVVLAVSLVGAGSGSGSLTARIEARHGVAVVSTPVPLGARASVFDVQVAADDGATVACVAHVDGDDVELSCPEGVPGR